MLFHDGLKKWWEKAAQKYLHEKWGLRDRQLRACGDTNKGTAYEGRVVGESPELCRAFDSHRFSDLETCINDNVAWALFLPTGHGYMFSLGTPGEAFSAMARS